MLRKICLSWWNLTLFVAFKVYGKLYILYMFFVIYMLNVLSWPFLAFKIQFCSWKSWISTVRVSLEGCWLKACTKNAFAIYMDLFLLMKIKKVQCSSLLFCRDPSYEAKCRYIEGVYYTLGVLLWSWLELMF